MVRKGRLLMLWRRTKVTHSPSTFMDMSMFALFFDSAMT
jgi:hypothetical protein